MTLSWPLSLPLFLPYYLVGAPEFKSLTRIGDAASDGFAVDPGRETLAKVWLGLPAPGRLLKHDPSFHFCVDKFR
ncbi:MAG: hypothetical protein ACREC4_03890, partial [Methylocella sp.]